jgi:hypothetical protein
VKPAVLLTRLSTLTMRLTRARSPTGGLQRAQQVHGHGAGSGLAFFGGHRQAQLADPGLAALLGDVAGQEHQVAVRTKGT